MALGLETSTLRGLCSVDPNALAQMTSLAASRRQVYLKLRIPAAPPYVLQALKIAATASVIGAIGVPAATWPDPRARLGRASSGLLLVSKKSANIVTPENLKGKNVGVWYGGNAFVTAR